MGCTETQREIDLQRENGSARLLLSLRAFPLLCFFPSFVETPSFDRMLLLANVSNIISYFVV